MNQNLKVAFEKTSVEDEAEELEHRSRAGGFYFFRRRSISLTSDLDSSSEAFLSHKMQTTTRRDSRDRDATPVPLERKKSGNCSRSSMIVHDASELERLANEIIDSVKDLDFMNEHAAASSSSQQQSSFQTKIKRNDSGYSTGSTGSVKARKLASEASLNETTGKSSRLSLGGLLKRNNTATTSSHPTSSGSSPVHSRIAKKIDRQLSKDTAASNSPSSKRSQFIQSRSHTGLNLFGGRRRSIAVTDDAYQAAIRTAKSHLDLLATASEANNEKANKKSNGLKKPQAQEASLRHRMQRKHFNERPWIELEKLWRGRAKDPPPDIETLILPSLRCHRAKTMPIGMMPPLGKSTPPRTPPTPQQSHSKGYWPPPPPTVNESTKKAADVTRKTIDLMTPQVLNSWMHRHGFSKSSENVSSPSIVEDPDLSRKTHFAELVKAW